MEDKEAEKTEGETDIQEIGGAIYMTAIDTVCLFQKDISGRRTFHD